MSHKAFAECDNPVFLWEKSTAACPELFNLFFEQFTGAVESICKAVDAEILHSTAVDKLLRQSDVVAVKLSAAFFADCHLISTTFAR